MNTSRFILAGMLTALLGNPLTVTAEDIDIYSGFGGAAGAPNILIVMDNAGSANTSLGTACAYADDGGAPALGNGTSHGSVQCALVNAALAIPLVSDATGNDAPAKVNLGLMIFDKDSPGGWLYQGIVPLNKTRRDEFIKNIKLMKAPDQTSNNARSGATMQEAWAYFMGETGMSGDAYALLKPSIGCENNFIIYIASTATNSSPGDISDGNVLTALKNAGATTEQQTKVFATGTNMDNNWADEWARFMRQSVDLNSADSGRQNIVTYTIAVAEHSNPQKVNQNHVTFMQSIASQGGGRSFKASTAKEIEQAILGILNEAQAVNSVFSSSSLPVSVNAQGTHLNQIFVGMFRPAEHAFPRWVGNLKQYQLIYDNTIKAVRLADKNGNWAISSGKSGFISPNAISFWTFINTSVKPDDSTTGGFFTNNRLGSGSDGKPNPFDSPDGEVVEKGAVAQQIRKIALTADYAANPTGPRNVYTYCPSGSSCDKVLAASANAFATTNTAITKELLDAKDPVLVSSIVRTAMTATAKATAKVTTATTHGFSDGASVSIRGATQREYNGTFKITRISGTEFIYDVAEYPPLQATGRYTASPPSDAARSVTLVTRSGTTATVTLNAHGYTNGQSITITGATQPEYNGTFTIANVTADTFTYPVPEGPVLVAGSHTDSSATAISGSTTKVINFWNDSQTAGVIRSGTTLTITTTSNHGLGINNKVTLAGIADSEGNLIPAYNDTFSVTSSKSNRSFTVALLETTPTSPATGTIMVDSAPFKEIIKLTRTGTKATAVTSKPHEFLEGGIVNIGGLVGVNENAYAGTVKITGVPADDIFEYNVVVSPASPATGGITASLSTNVDRTTLINWIRGEDNFGDESGPGNGITVRPSVHGDVLHSRPAVINYGSLDPKKPRVVAFYGTNDGTYRAVNGNQTSSIGSFGPGEEMWAFIPPEFFDKFPRLRSNSPVIKLPTTPDGILPAPKPRDYFADGPTSVYQKLKDDTSTGKTVPITDTAYLYIAMRRGGRFLYALDVSDATASPKFMWKKGCYPSGVCDAGYEEMGQTWSEPKIARIKGHTNPVLIFGAGYDRAEDVEPPVANTMGRGIYILDYLTGDIVWSATSASSPATNVTAKVSGMNYAIPSDITLLDRDRDGNVERLYATDVGGNVWRVDLEPPEGYTPGKFKVYKFAALGCDAGVCAAGVSPRKFFYPADVIPIGVAGTSTSYDAVLVGSGDREHPLYDTALNSAYKVVNQFYMLKDLKTVGHSETEAVITQSAASPDGLFNASLTEYDGSRRGYYFKFQNPDGTMREGEKVVNAPSTVQGFTFFGTNQPPTPSTMSCDTKLGTARGYSISPITGVRTYAELNGGGMPPTAVSGVTTALDTDGKARDVRFCLGCTGGINSENAPPDCKSSIGACKPEYKGSKRLKRTYWHTNQ